MEANKQKWLEIKRSIYVVLSLQIQNILIKPINQQRTSQEQSIVLKTPRQPTFCKVPQAVCFHWKSNQYIDRVFQEKAKNHKKGEKKNRWILYWGPCKKISCPESQPPLRKQTWRISRSLSWGRWQVTFSKAVICLSFNLFEYLCPSTILQTWINLKIRTYTAQHCWHGVMVSKLSANLHWQIIWPILISNLKTRPLNMLNWKAIGLPKILNNWFHGATIIDWKTDWGKKEKGACEKSKMNNSLDTLNLQLILTSVLVWSVMLNQIFDIFCAYFHDVSLPPSLLSKPS